jgi:hypothetical protein
VKVPDSEGLTNHTGLESCAGVGNGVGEALIGEGADRVLSPEIDQSWVPTRSEHAECDTACPVMAWGGQPWLGRSPLAGTETLCVEPGRPCFWPGIAARSAGEPTGYDRDRRVQGVGQPQQLRHERNTLYSTLLCRQSAWSLKTRSEGSWLRRQPESGA